MTWECPVCHARIDDSITVCPRCGTIRGFFDADNSQPAPAKQAQQELQQVHTPPPANVPQAASSSSQLKLEQVTCPFCGSIVYANVPEGVPDSNTNYWDAIVGDVYVGYYYYLIAINHCPECGKEFYISKDENGNIRTLKNIKGFSELNPIFESQIDD